LLMSLPSGTPSRKRTTTSQPTLVAKAYSSAKTMNMTIVARNMTRRPILSDSQPPTSAPPRVPAAARPSGSGSGLIAVGTRITARAAQIRMGSRVGRQRVAIRHFSGALSPNRT